jgi:hypothetical protein
MRALPARQLAVLVCGLRENSRLKSKQAGLEVSYDTFLNAGIMDRITHLIWMLSSDGQEGENCPESLAETMLSDAERSKIIKTKVAGGFESGEAFEKARAQFFK